MPEPLGVRVPASSANLGPGFDAVGLALGLYIDVEIAGGQLIPETHPAQVAFDRLGGLGRLSLSGPIPPGRGLGYSGAAYAGGAALALLQDGGSIDDVRDEVFAVAAELEGHPENAAASVHGGLVVVVEGAVVTVPIGVDLEVVTWTPSTETSTRAARASLPDTVPFADAVFNVGHAAFLVAALAAGDLTAVGIAVSDRLHQDIRLERQPVSAIALAAMQEAGAVAAWVSGSGPTVAAFVPAGGAEPIVSALPSDGRIEILPIDTVGITNS